MRIPAAASMFLLIATILANCAASAETRVVLKLEDNGSVDLDGEHITDRAKIVTSLKELLARKPPPEIVIQTPKNVRFENVGRLIMLMREAGVPKIGIITQPPK